MAYDFGSSGLGIANPFKKEGFIRFISGTLISLLGVYALLQVTSFIEEQLLTAWIYAAAGFLLLVTGLRRCGSGLMQMFKFFVGRSVPSSLAMNLTKSERENAKLEAQKGSLAYSSSTLESMLMGRKNATFTEPQGWMGRLVHSVFPRLVFMPYPIRNVVQQVFSAVTTTIIAMLAFALTYFVASSGLTGTAGHIIIPAFSVLLLLYLVAAWRKAAVSVRLDQVKTMQSANAASVAKIIAFSIVFPVLIGFGYHSFVNNLSPQDLAQLAEYTAGMTSFSAWPLFLLMLTLAAVTTGLVLTLVKHRANLINTSTEVAEYRENLQESVHPNEIFINIENIVLANRRYKEVPNRTYIDFNPRLNEQSQGKGDFSGELLIETQPAYAKHQDQPAFAATRLAATVLAQVFMVAAALLFLALTSKVVDVHAFITSYSFDNLNEQSFQTMLNEGSAVLFGAITTLFAFLIVSMMGRLLEGFTHVFWAELQFNSLLMYMKTEGTFTESKISTGMSIHDSTRSENVIVKSSITPWIVSSRITTSTFASSGQNNVEMPRYVMSMHKNQDELDIMVQEIRDFLRGRETIAGFTNTKDLQQAENILRVNQASRGQTDGSASLTHKQDEEAAGYLRNQQESSNEDQPGEQS
ncbi:hypothetical protein CWE15_08830 [Aliidiomarina taiwanensis]|uniref:Uncharacterized protein n=1 Tax=Aliidiomarina taiwanensis TaxID=946228 RepID=A0A432X134_9GAMM|nr:hypothetical protein [Aliidiomarina taiwanensis]RUO39848.1 hypothetical protein CWE15_08830 [Aliidiomarina taiwanensis]